MMRSAMILLALLAVPGEGVHYRPTVLVQLGVSDLDRAVRFYTDVLEFTVTERRDDLKFVHLSTKVEGLEIGLSEQETPNGSGTVRLNFGVADVAAARRTLEARGVIFSRPIMVVPGKVALAEFTDPDGNVLRFAGPPPRMP